MESPDQKRVFDDWMNAHQGILFKVVRSYAATAHDRDDLFQEIAIQVWNSVPRYRGESAVSTWIYRVALYSALRWSRGERTRRDRSIELDAHAALLAPVEPPSDPRLEQLYLAIAKLPALDRSFVILLLDGRSHAEMAATLGITENHVAVKLHRIKRTLTQLTAQEKSE